MSTDAVYSFAVQGIWLVGVLIFPLVASAVGVGLLFSLIQALTQINEAALTLCLKLAVMAIVGVLVFPWMAAEMKNFILLGFQLAAKGGQ